MPSATTHHGPVDVYLTVRGDRAGPVKGESVAVGHKDDIVAQTWNWGIAASSALGSTERTGRRTYKNLVVTKRIDSASTALMSFVARNEAVSVKLCMRKSGEGQKDFFTISLEEARVNSVDLDCDEAGATVERVAFSFNKVTVDYAPKGTSYTDEIRPT